MQQLTFDHLSYKVGNRRVFLISGEIHYFRIAPDQWRDRLTKFKESGGNCVATYVPWLVHEPQEGQFNFDGALDVEHFLALCRELGLWALVRPGPYQYSELIYSGLPGWLVENHPQLRARHLDGKPFETASVSYVHPLFLEKTKRWFDDVIPRLARRQVSQGGAVVAIQIDNEMTGIHDWFGGWDYHPESMGVGREDGRWPEFLKRRYGTLAAVNGAYETQAGSWSQVLPIKPRTEATPAERRRMQDYQDCYYASVADYAEILADWMEELGMDVPMVHNSPGPEVNPRYLEIVHRLGRKFLLGSDHYYSLDQNWPQNNPTPQYASRVLTSLEMLRELEFPPTVYELPGGSLADWPPITAQDAAACYLTNIALGMKGYNYYIFAGGANPPGCGTTGEIYDYGAALSPSGEKRPLYFVQRKLAGFLKEHEWLAGAQRVTDFNVALVWEQTRCRQFSGGGLLGAYEAWMFARTGVMSSALSAGLSPGLLDLSSDDCLRHTDKPMVLASGSSVPRHVQERLTRFVSAGGKLLIAPVVPTLDEHWRPCTILADFIQAGRQEKLVSVAPLLDGFDVRNIFVNGLLLHTPPGRPDAMITSREQRSGSAVGWTRNWPAGGIVSVLGFGWLHAKHEHSAMLKAALGQLGLSPRIHCDNPNVWTALHADGNRSMLFLLNLLSSPMIASAGFRDAHGAWIDTGRHELPAMTVRVWCDGETII